jgi:dTMP kinase
MRLKGKMFDFDGIDGSGKHTQAEMLRSSLLKMRKKVLLISFPRYEDTFFGRELRKALAGDYGNFVDLDPHLASQLYAADRWASKQTILQALSSGVNVICDRYVSANQIHQGGKLNNPRKRRNFLAWLEQLEYGEYKIPRPDVAIYLDVPPAVSKTLMSDRTRDTVENNPRYLENSHRSAQWLIKEAPDKWLHVKCTKRGLMRTREEIHDEVMSRLRELSLL